MFYYPVDVNTIRFIGGIELPPFILEVKQVDSLKNEYFIPMCHRYVGQVFKGSYIDPSIGIRVISEFIYGFISPSLNLIPKNTDVQFGSSSEFYLTSSNSKFSGCLLFDIPAGIREDICYCLAIRQSYDPLGKGGMKDAEKNIKIKRNI
jgi:hypothetical protein